MISVSSMGCASRPVDPLVVGEAAPQAALTLEQAVPYRCPPVSLSPAVPGDYLLTLKGTALDYKSAEEDCARRNADAIDLLTRVPGTPDPAAAPPVK